MSTLVGLAVLVEEALFLVAIVFLSFLLEVFLERLVVLLEWFVPFLEGRAFLSKVLADAVEVGVVLLLVGALLVKFATFLAELFILAAEKFILAELARDASVVEVDLERRLEADEVEGSAFLAAAGAWIGVGECGVGIVARDDPGFGTLEVFLQHACHHAVEGGDIGKEAFAIGGIHHDDATEGLLAFGQRFGIGLCPWCCIDLLKILYREGNVLLQTSFTDVFGGDIDGDLGDVRSVDVVQEFLFLRIVIVEFLPEVVVVSQFAYGPTLEAEALAIESGRCVGGDERSLDEEGSRAAHGVIEVACAVVAGLEQDACGKHFADGGVGELLLVAALVERVAARVEAERALRTCDIGVSRVGDVQVELHVGRTYSHFRTPLSVFYKVVADGILGTINGEA